MSAPRISAGVDGPITVRADDGVDLALWRRRADAPANRRAVPVLLVHGTFSNRNFFLGTGERGLAHYLASRGFESWVAELRGHGRSGAAGKGTAWRFEDWILRDAPALLRGVRDASGSESVAWIGHSAGGVIAVAYAGLQAELSGAIGGIVMAGAPAPTRPGAWHVPLAAIGYGITRLVGRFPARALRIGPEDEQPGIMQQWMEWNVRGNWIGENGTDYLANARRISAPALALAGGFDPIAPAATCRLLLDALGGADRTFLKCGRGSGFSENFSHNRLLVSTPARQEVWPRIAEWLEARFS